MCEGGCSWRGAVHRDSRPSQRCCYKVCILWTSKFLCLVSLCFLVGVVYFDLLYHFFLFGLLCLLLFVGQPCFAMSDICLLVWLDCFLWFVLLAKLLCLYTVVLLSEDLVLILICVC